MEFPVTCVIQMPQILILKRTPNFRHKPKRHLLRDMINWCIENPQEGKKLSGDDPRMKALESYMISIRAGKVIEPGKH
ncbi:MAG: hypothetical protein ACE5GU_05000 [Candidatus Scalinduaceae bacterium]